MPDSEQTGLGDTLRWALETITDPVAASADWLARDIDPAKESALELLTDRAVSLETLTKAKHVFKTMRILGETSADRRMGARLYAATIAAGLVYHDARISTQSDAALTRALRSLLDDQAVPDPLRNLAGAALSRVSA